MVNWIPDSISATVYGMPHPFIWTLCVWVGGGTILPLMLSCSGDNWQWLAFLSCACLLLVGAMPLIKGNHNTLHNVLGALSCVLGQIWCAVMWNWVYVLIGWGIFVLTLPIWTKKWCFVAEIICIINTIVAISQLS